MTSFEILQMALKHDFLILLSSDIYKTSCGARFTGHNVVAFQKHVILTFPVPIYFN